MSNAPRIVNPRTDDPEPWEGGPFYVQLGPDCVVVCADHSPDGVWRLTFDQALHMGEYLSGLADWQLMQRDRDQ